MTVEPSLAIDSLKNNNRQQGTKQRWRIQNNRHFDRVHSKEDSTYFCMKPSKGSALIYTHSKFYKSEPEWVGLVVKVRGLGIYSFLRFQVRNLPGVTNSYGESPFGASFASTSILGSSLVDGRIDSPKLVKIRVSWPEHLSYKKNSASLWHTP